MTLLSLLAGFALLVGSAEALVRGASRLAVALGISPLIVGLTIVALGTSSPEIALALDSVLEGAPDLAVGNVLGSNILNVLLVLGLSALIAPLIVRRRLVRLEVPLMIGVSCLALLLALDGLLGPLEGSLLILGFIVYTTFLLTRCRADGESPRCDPVPGAEVRAGGADVRAGGAALGVLFLLVGFAGLALGAPWLVHNATAFASQLGVSELFIGLTVLALGTSLPELVTCTVAAVRRHADIAIGNVVGSNLMNLFVVLGAASLVAPGGIRITPAALGFDFPAMVLVAIACLPVFFIGNRVSRWEGALLLGYYAAYVGFLALDSTGHSALPTFREVMLLLVIPVTVLTLAVTSLRQLARRSVMQRQSEPSA